MILSNAMIGPLDHYMLYSFLRPHQCSDNTVKYAYSLKQILREQLLRLMVEPMNPQLGFHEKLDRLLRASTRS